MNNKRINLFFIIFSFIFVSGYATAQSGGNWVSHLSYWQDVYKIAQSKDKVFALTDGKLFIYNKSDNSLEDYVKPDGWNTNITHIAYNPKHECLFITRTDQNIDLLYNNRSYVNIPDLKNSSQNIDKTINSIFIDESLAYISTNFGFITINIEKVEVKESGIFNTPFYSICSFENKLYAATQDGILVADKSSNILDRQNWVQFPVSQYYSGTEAQFTDNSIRSILVFKDKLHFLIPNKSAYIMDTPTSVQKIISGSNPQSMVRSENDHLIIINPDSFYEYQNLNDYKSTKVESLIDIVPDNSKQGEYWLASSGNNLSLIKLNETGFDFLSQWIAPRGPVSNFPFSLTYENNQLIVTGGGFYNNRYDNPASLSILNDLKWTNIDSYTISQESGLSARDFAYAISEPSKPNHIFVTSWGEGLYEFEDNHLIKVHNHTNSTIEELVTADSWRTTRVSGMTYDRSGNLWVLNSMVENPLKVYQKNGVWSKIYFPEIDKADTNIKNILIDRYSNKWVISFGQDRYLFIFNENGTIDNTADDKSRYINSFVDQNNNLLSIVDINSIAQDNDGNIWISTDIGPFIIYNTSDIFNRNPFQLNKIMIGRDTGSGSVIGLLEEVPINTIAIDGANRKWIATQTSGVYLVGSNMEEGVLENFTVDNSPLPSNNILSLAINPQNGEVYIGTDKGLMSYKTGVTPGSENFSDVYVYPNPVRPDYTGLITITGLKTNSRIKITDVKGNLIIEGKSLGGQYTWDGVNAKGKRVDTGVYLVFGSSEDGSEGVVTKIMFVN